MEIGVRIDAESPFTGEVRHTATAYLTFVAIDDKNKPTKIPKIIPENDGTLNIANNVKCGSIEKKMGINI